MTVTTSESLKSQIRAIAEDVVRPPMFVVETIVRGNKGSRVVEIYVDSEGDLSVDALAAVSREIGFLLDAKDCIDGRYKLNVSSPGADRPLVRPVQFKKNRGRKARVLFSEYGRPPVEGTLEDADDEGFLIQTGKNRKNRLGYEEVKEVRVLLPW